MAGMSAGARAAADAAFADTEALELTFRNGLGILKKNDQKITKRSKIVANKTKKKKKGGPLNVVLTLGILVCIGIIAYSGYKLISTGLAYKEGVDEYNGLRKYTMEVADPEDTDSGSQETAAESVSQENSKTPVDGSAQEEEEPVVVPLQVDFASLQAINPDIVGWIYIEALDISYPIVQGEDNDFYLHRTFEKKDNFAGSIFMEYRNSADFSDPNTIIYGHNMKNQSMFGKLKLLKEWGEYKNSMYFWILTPENNYRYEIFNVQYTDASSDVYTLFSEPGTLFVDYLEKMQSQAEIPVEEREFTVDDKAVTLSTCSSSTGDGRFVVQGVRVAY